MQYCMDGASKARVAYYVGFDCDRTEHQTQDSRSGSQSYATAREDSQNQTISSWVKNCLFIEASSRGIADRPSLPRLPIPSFFLSLNPNSALRAP